MHLVKSRADQFSLRLTVIVTDLHEGGGHLSHGVTKIAKRNKRDRMPRSGYGECFRRMLRKKRAFLKTVRNHPDTVVAHC